MNMKLVTIDPEWEGQEPGGGALDKLVYTGTKHGRLHDTPTMQSATVHRGLVIAAAIYCFVGCISYLVYSEIQWGTLRIGMAWIGWASAALILAMIACTMETLDRNASGDIG